jgi:hypothetical protein
LRAIGGVDVPTHVLAVELAGPVADEKTVDALERRLQRQKGDLSYFVVPNKRTLRWTIPTLEMVGVSAA